MLTLAEAMKERHSVRQYLPQPLSDEDAADMQAEIDRCNREGGLHIQLIRDEPQAFEGGRAHYGKFSGVTSYIAMVGPRGGLTEEKCGYYGEQLVLYAQRIGLNTCWVYLTYNRVPDVIQIDPGEKLAIVIALGYGATQGSRPMRRKKIEQVSENVEPVPQWFKDGVNAALLAPTAMNLQAFRFRRNDDVISLRVYLSPCAQIDRGILKYHFEQGAGANHFRWDDKPRNDLVQFLLPKEYHD